MSEHRYEKLAAEIAQELAIITTLTGKEARVIAEAAVKIATFDTLRAAAQDIPAAYQHGDSPSAWLTRRANQLEEA